MFEPKVFRKQMQCFEKSAYVIIGTFWPPAVIWRPENCVALPPSLHLWCYSIKIGKFSVSKPIFKSERHEHQFSNTIRLGSCTECQQRLLAAFQFSSCGFVSLLCLPHAFFRRGPVFVLLITKVFSDVQQVTFLRLGKFENNF